MSRASSIICLYYLPQSFPCGPQSSCCGPMGQSEEELRGYVTQLETNLPGVRIETIDISQKLSLGRDLAALKLLNAFGPAACPIFSLDGEVVSIGPPAISELLELVKAKVAAGGEPMDASVRP